MKKLLLASLLALILSIVPLTLVGADQDIIWEKGDTQTLETGYGVYAETHFWGMYAGWSGTAPLVIVNGKDKGRTFLITIEQPGKPERGFEALPEECYSWITISDNLVTALAGETIQVPVTITIPADIVYVNKNQQVALQVREAGQGLVQIALQSKWFISTAPYIPPIDIPLIEGGVSMPLIIGIAAVAMGVGGYVLMRRRRGHATK